MFIVFEGIDGSGKTTQAELLKKSLEKQGFSVVLTKEPTKNSTVSEKIRQILKKEVSVSPKKLQELFIQDRKEHLENFVIPSLEEGKIVISDRYYFSTIVYGASEEVSTSWLIEKNRDFLKPDITFIFDIDAEVCIERIKKGERSFELFEKMEKLKLIREEYKKLPKYFDNLIFIDAKEDIKKIHLKLMNLILNKIQKQA